LAAGHPKHFYRFKLVDAFDQPYATFKYHYRSWEELADLGVAEIPKFYLPSLKLPAKNDGASKEEDEWESVDTVVVDEEGFQDFVPNKEQTLPDDAADEQFSSSESSHNPLPPTPPKGTAAQEAEPCEPSGSPNGLIGGPEGFGKRKGVRFATTVTEIDAIDLPGTSSHPFGIMRSPSPNSNSTPDPSAKSIRGLAPSSQDSSSIRHRRSRDSFVSDTQLSELRRLHNDLHPDDPHYTPYGHDIAPHDASAPPTPPIKTAMKRLSIPPSHMLHPSQRPYTPTLTQRPGSVSPMMQVPGAFVPTPEHSLKKEKSKTTVRAGTPSPVKEGRQYDSPTLGRRSAATMLKGLVEGRSARTVRRDLRGSVD